MMKYVEKLSHEWIHISVWLGYLKWYCNLLWWCKSHIL